MKKFYKDIMTEKDNKTFCAVKVIMIFSSASFVVFTAYHVLVHGSFDAQAFGTGIGIITGGGGLGVLAKDK